VDKRSGAMHGKRFLIRELFYGSDGQNLYLRLDFEPAAAGTLPGTDARLTVEGGAGTSSVALRFTNERLEEGEVRLADPRHDAPLQFAFRKVLEVRLSLAALGVASGASLRLQLSLWKDGLPVDAVPQEGWLEISTAEPADWQL
jgi:hypothetical protein